MEYLTKVIAEKRKVHSDKVCNQDDSFEFYEFDEKGNFYSSYLQFNEYLESFKDEIEQWEENDYFNHLKEFLEDYVESFEEEFPEEYKELEGKEYHIEYYNLEIDYDRIILNCSISLK